MEHEAYNQDICSFNRLYENYRQPFVRFANSYIRDFPAAEDITVEAMMYYWENRRNIRADSDIPAYILAIIKHKCLNYLRHVHIQENYTAQMKNYHEWELSTRIATLEACEPNELFHTEIEELVQQAFARMPVRTRDIFIMSRYENKSYKEIAAAMGITVKGVDFHMGKALKMLRNELTDYFPLFLYFLSIATGEMPS